MVPRPETKPNPDDYATVHRRIVLTLTDQDRDWLEAVVEAAGCDPSHPGEESALARAIIEQLKGNRIDWSPERGLHTVPFNDGSGLAEHDDRVVCPDCHGKGARHWSNAVLIRCELCGGTGRVNPVLIDQRNRMSAS